MWMIYTLPAACFAGYAFSLFTHDCDDMVEEHGWDGMLGCVTVSALLGLLWPFFVFFCIYIRFFDNAKGGE